MGKRLYYKQAGLIIFVESAKRQDSQDSLTMAGIYMKYYIWLDTLERPLSKAWRYEDETERMVAEAHSPAPDAVLRAGTREQLIDRFGLRDEDFAEP